MDPVALDEILSCQTLPSLPAVAVRVLELTADTDVSMHELAATITGDQALSSKILRTVNSSFFGLRQRCASIDRALVMLGLGPVKSLALGFSLVTALGDGDDQEPFDYVAYWRRGLYTAVSARLIAEAAKVPHADEAFLGGLLQDIGMIAMYQALGRRYLDVVDAAGDHHELVRCELTALDLQHPDIGAMLAERWKLPEELVLPVKYHERPTAAPPACAGIVRAVGLGNLVHDALTLEDPTPAMRRLYEHAGRWFGLRGEACDGVVESAAGAAREMSSLFSLDTGGFRNAGEVLERARAQLIESSRASAAEDPSLLGIEDIADAHTERDELTGLLSREGFDTALGAVCAAAAENRDAVCVVEVAAETGCKPDAAALGLAALLRKHFEPVGGVAGRLSLGLFAVAIRGVQRRAVERLCEAFRVETRQASTGWTHNGSPLTLAVGIAASDEHSTGGLGDPHQYIAAAAKAVMLAREEGGERVRTFVPKQAA